MRFFFFFSTLLLSTAACGGIAVIDVDPQNNDGGGGSTSSSMNTGGNTTGGDIQAITLDEALAFVDCFPGGGDGELELSFTMSFENVSSNTASVEIPEARIQGIAGQTFFAVSPSVFQVSGNSVRSIEFEKAGPGTGTRGCDWCTPTDTNLEVEMLVDGVPRTFTDGIDSVSCSF